jgi:hypothetical protein
MPISSTIKETVKIYAHIEDELQTQLGDIRASLEHFQKLEKELEQQLHNARTSKEQALRLNRRDRRRSLNRGRKKMYSYIENHPGCTRADLVSLFPAGTVRGVTMMLYDLEKEDFVVNLGSKAHPLWHVVY